MSVRVMSLVFENEDLSSTEKLIMLALADHANDEGKSIYPSQNRVSRKTGLVRQTVNLHIRGLINKGYLNMVGYKIDRSNVLELEINVKMLSTGGGVVENDTLPKGVVKENDMGVSRKVTRDVVVEDTNHHINTIDESSLNTTAADNCFKVYEQEIGMLTSFISERLKADIDDYTEGWVVDAIKVASESNVRNLKYVEAILARWKRQGKDKKKYKPGEYGYDYKAAAESFEERNAKERKKYKDSWLGAIGQKP